MILQKCRKCSKDLPLIRFREREKSFGRKKTICITCENIVNSENFRKRSDKELEIKKDFLLKLRKNYLKPTKEIEKEARKIKVKTKKLLEKKAYCNICGDSLNEPKISVLKRQSGEFDVSLCCQDCYLRQKRDLLKAYELFE